MNTTCGWQLGARETLHDFILFLALEYLASHTLKACDVFITGDFENI